MQTHAILSERWLPRLALLVLTILLAGAGFAPTAVQAQAEPGDVFYSAQVLQRFKYYVFVDDFVDWASTTVEGTSFQWAAARGDSELYPRPSWRRARHLGRAGHLAISWGVGERSEGLLEGGEVG